MSKFVLALDIDGVLNAVSKNPPLIIWDEWEQEDVLEWRRQIKWSFLVSKRVLQYFRDLHELGEIEIRTLSTWRENSVEVYNTFNLPHFPVIPVLESDFPAFETMYSWWKLTAFSRFIQETDQIALWIDDDLKYSPPATQWIPTHGVGISPRTELGLTPKNLTEINAFLTDRGLTAPTVEW